MNAFNAIVHLSMVRIVRFILYNVYHNKKNKQYLESLDVELPASLVAQRLKHLPAMQETWV